MNQSILGASYSEAFSLLNGVLLAWLLLVVAPRFRYTMTICTATALLYAAVYTVVIAQMLSSESIDFNEMSSLEGVMGLFARQDGAFAGWTHYIVFDLWIGMWMVKDSQQHRVSHFLVVPCLVANLMLGPVGLLFYHGVRMLFGGRREADKQD